MNKKKIVLVALTLITILSVTVAYAYIAGVITIPWSVKPVEVGMYPSEITIPLGTFYPGQTMFQDPPKESVADLFVNVETADIIVDLGGDYDSGFDNFSVTIELWTEGEIAPAYTATVSNTEPTAVMPSVAHGTYDVYVGFYITSKSLHRFGELIGIATVTLSYH